MSAERVEAYTSGLLLDSFAPPMSDGSNYVSSADIRVEASLCTTDHNRRVGRGREYVGVSDGDGRYANVLGVSGQANCWCKIPQCTGWTGMCPGVLRWDIEGWKAVLSVPFSTFHGRRPRRQREQTLSLRPWKGSSSR